MKIDFSGGEWPRPAVVAAALVAFIVWVALSTYDAKLGTRLAGIAAIGFGLTGVVRRKITFRGKGSRRPAKTYSGLSAVIFGTLLIALGVFLYWA
jgi:hypothetical protein